MTKDSLEMDTKPRLSPARRQYIEIPLPLECRPFRRMFHLAAGVVLGPIYLAAAGLTKAPGVLVHLRCALWGLQMLGLRRLSIRSAASLIFSPMDSTRYFELHEVFKSLRSYRFRNYLDISSPRLVPLILLSRRKDARACLVNPDGKDLDRTAELATALKLDGRCRFIRDTLEKMDLPDGAFDLVTSISVLEHIPDDRAALERMWALLRTDGRLVLSLPCMANPLEQYISRNDFGLLPPGPDGYTFWQRYYDEQRLRSAVFDITGYPNRWVVYGERTPGLFFRNASAKRLLHALYPFWKEPYMMAREYSYFPALCDLPGEGVAVFEFVKR